MKCCIIGGAGFIGSYVTRQLAGSGREVIVLGRNPKPQRQLPKQAHYVSGDYGDRALMSSLLADTEEVVNCAYTTVPKTSFEDPIYDINTNLPQSVNLIQEAARFRLRKIVIVSSGGTVYGTPRQIPITEEHPTNPISPYGITKLTIEKYAGMFVSIGVPVVIVRPANAYGEDQKAFTGQGFIATSIQSILLKRKIEVFGNPGTVRDYLHVSDIARGIIAALDCGVTGEIYNIGSGTGRNNLEVIEHIAPLAAKSGYACDVDIRPYRQFDVRTNILDSTKLRSHSGWAPQIAFPQGIRQVWDSALSRL